MNKKQSRLRRAMSTRKKIKELKINRLSVFRSNLHIYASIISPNGGYILVSASTLESSIRSELIKSDKLGNFRGNNRIAAEVVGKYLAERAKAAGIEIVSFDRSGFRYHGRIKALAEAARQAGLNF